MASFRGNTIKTHVSRYWLAVLVGVLTCGFSCDASQSRDASANFGNYKPLAALVAKADKVVVYEGLPHQASEGDLLEKELQAKKTVTLHEFPFYAEPAKLGADDAEALTKLFTSDDSFDKFEGEKKCGGFHPDYCIEWQIGDKRVHCHMCFGCHEAKVYGPDNTLRCDIKRAAFENFESTLQSYRKQRPTRETPSEENQ